MNGETKLQELERLRTRVRELEHELAQQASSPREDWPPHGFYAAYEVTTGFLLGAAGAATSLLFNVVGSAFINQSPLRLIQVYLTFPLGSSALQIDSGLALAIGCTLYLLTGMVLGIPFQVVLSRWFAGSSFAVHFAVVTAMALLLWVINFYVLIAWLQPLLFGGNWIIDNIPWWVAAATHLVFGWTMLLVHPYGRFVGSGSPRRAPA